TEEAIRLVSQIRSDEDRVTMLVQLANTEAGKGDKNIAIRLLGDARAIVNGRAENSLQLTCQLQIASAYSLLQPSQSFEIIEPIVDQANELIAAAALLDGFQNLGQRRFKDGEMIIQT